MTDLIGKTLGAYQVLLKISSNGLTTIYKAFDPKLGRNVTLQVIESEIAQHPAFQEKVKKQAGVLAKLNHPNIGSILDCNEYEGEFCLVYDIEPHEILRSKFHQKMSWRQASKILLPIAQALETAHSVGIIHGHLSPANIMISTDGTPYLFDFGIDLLLQQEILETSQGHWIGIGANSLQSPEQNEGKNIDVRTDIYSFGAILFSLLTDQRPFEKDAPIFEIQTQYEKPPCLPKSLKKELTPIEQSILLRMLATDPKDRFQHISHVCSLLTCIALRLPVSKKAIYDDAWAYKRNKHQPAFALIGVSFVLFVLVAAFLFTKQPWSSAATLPSPMISTPTTIPSPELTPTPVTTFVPTPTVPVNTISQGAPELPMLENSPLPKPAAAITQDGISRMVELGQLGQGKFTDVAWSTDGKQIALASSTGIYFLDPLDFVLDDNLSLSSWITSIRYSPDGALLAVGDRDGLIRIIRTADKTIASTLNGCTGKVSRIEFSSEGDFLAALFDKESVCLWSTEDNRLIRAASDFPQGILAIRFARNRQFYITLSSEDEVSWWNMGDGSLIDTRKSPTHLTSLAITADSQGVIAVDQNGHLWGWVLENKSSQDLGTSLGKGIFDVQISPDGKYIVAGDSKGDIVVMNSQGVLVWSSEKALVTNNSETGEDFEPKLSFSPDSKYVLSANTDGRLRIWDLDSDQEVTPEKTYFYGFENLVLSNRDEYLAAQTSNDEVKVWDLAQQKLLFTLPGFLVDGNPFSPDARYLAIKNNNADIEIIDLSDGSIINTLTSGQSIQSIVFSPSTQLLAAGSQEDIHVWSTVNWQEIKLQLSYSKLGCKDFRDANGQIIGVAFLRNYLIFNDSAGAGLCALKPTGWMKFVTWNLPRELAAAGGPGKLQVWDYPSNGKNTKVDIQTARGIDYSSGAFLQDGSMLLVAANNYAIMAFNPITGVQVGSFLGHSDTVTDLLFTSDGQYLISSSLDGTIRIWGIQ